FAVAFGPTSIEAIPPSPLTKHININGLTLYLNITPNKARSPIPTREQFAAPVPNVRTDSFLAVNQPSPHTPAEAKPPTAIIALNGLNPVVVNNEISSILNTW